MPMRARMVCITRMMRYDEWLAPTARILIHILLPPLNTPTRNRFGPDRNPRRNQRLILCGVPCRELRTRVLLVPIATPHGRPCLRLRTRSRNRRCCRLMRRRHPARGGNCSRARSKPASARKASGKAEQSQRVNPHLHVRCVCIRVLPARQPYRILQMFSDGLKS